MSMLSDLGYFSPAICAGLLVTGLFVRTLLDVAVNLFWSMGRGLA